MPFYRQTDNFARKWVLIWESKVYIAKTPRRKKLTHDRKTSGERDFEKRRRDSREFIIFMLDLTHIIYSAWMASLSNIN